MSELFTVAVHRDGTRVVIAPRGELDLATAPALEGALESVLSDSPGVITIDLSQVGFLDLTGLRALQACAAAAFERGAGFTLTGASAQAERLFRMCGWDQPRSCMGT